MAANYDPNRYLDPALQRLRGRGGFGLGGQTFLGAAPAPVTAPLPAGGTRLGGLAQGQTLRQPGVVTMAPGRYGMGYGSQSRISARPTARNSSEYYAQRDAVAGNPLDNLELGNRDMMRQAQRLMMRGQAGTQAQPLAGSSTFNADTGKWQGVPLMENQSIADIEAGRMAANLEEADTAALMEQARLQEIEDRRMRAMFQSGAQVTDEMDVPTAIGGLPRDLYWQREANRGMASNVAPMPGFGLGKGGRAAVPFQPTAAGAQYFDRLSGFYRR